MSVTLNSTCTFHFVGTSMFGHCSNHRYNSGTQISAETCVTVHKYIVAEVVCSKKSSSALLVYK